MYLEYADAQYCTKFFSKEKDLSSQIAFEHNLIHTVVKFIWRHQAECGLNYTAK